MSYYHLCEEKSSKPVWKEIMKNKPIFLQVVPRGQLASAPTFALKQEAAGTFGCWSVALTSGAAINFAEKFFPKSSK